MTIQLEQRITDNAFAIDEDGQFPTEEFEWMKEEGLLNITLPNNCLDFNLPKLVRF